LFAHESSVESSIDEMIRGVVLVDNIFIDRLDERLSESKSRFFFLNVWIGISVESIDVLKFCVNFISLKHIEYGKIYNAFFP